MDHNVINDTEYNTINRDYLMIYVVGTGKGEGIAIHLPGNKWGVVDCCKKGEKGGTNFILSWLDQFGVFELEFVALTHPHWDHIRGISQILESKQVKEIWTYSGTTFRDLLARQHDYIQEIKKGNIVASNFFGETTDELEKFLSFMKENDQIKVRFLRAEDKPIYSYKTDAGIEVCCRCLSPGNDDIKFYMDGLNDVVDKKTEKLREPTETTSRNDEFNWISASFSITYGKTKIVLGGDVMHNDKFLNRGWNGIVRRNQESSENSLQATAIKISHHGSRRSLCSDAWDMHDEDESCKVSILTPFSHKLPKIQEMEYFCKYSRALVYTSLPKKTDANVLRKIKYKKLSNHIFPKIKKQGFPNSLPRVGAVAIAFDHKNEIQMALLRGEARSIANG